MTVSLPRRAWLLGALAVLLGGWLYVSQYWSPSSYGLVLRQLGQADAGLVFGEPRAVRSDEWAVVTPLTRATVNNGLARHNRTSLYAEDLRINYGLPVTDWGLVFKPTMWPYLWADPARAFSFHWYATLVLFLAGHALLFARIGLAPALAALLALGLYFAPFTQFWWSEKGPIMAFFPWVVGVLLTRWPMAVRLLLCYWVGASWLITNFYPPLFLSLAFVGALLLLAFGREWLRPSRLLALGVTAAAAGATAALYLKDYLQATARTVYPGGRTVGGGSVPWYEWWAQLFPFSTFDAGYESVRGQNICEVGVVGAAFILVVLCALQYGRLPALVRRGSPWRLPLVILGGGLLLMYAWMLLPLRAWVGAPLLWNHVQPERMEYAAGLLLMVLVALLADKAGLALTRWRLLAYAVLVFAGWGLLKLAADPAARARGFWPLGQDLLVLPMLLACLAVAYGLRARAATAVLGASALSGAVVLFGFNPIQSAQPIFAPPPSHMAQQIEQDRTHPGGPVAATGWPGATLNGLGYASVSHVTPVPALAYWRTRYPDWPEDRFMAVFNRYTHVVLDNDAREPYSPQSDVVRVPVKDFWPDRSVVPAQPGGAAQPHWLGQGEALRGDLLPPRGGPLQAVAPFIGTAHGQSDGQLHVRVCQAERCAEGATALKEARDNDYAHVRLRTLLDVHAGAPLHYEIALREGRHAVAVWLYPVAPPEGVLSGRAGREAMSPRFMLNY